MLERCGADLADHATCLAPDDRAFERALVCISDQPPITDLSDGLAHGEIGSALRARLWDGGGSVSTGATTTFLGVRPFGFIRCAIIIRADVEVAFAAPAILARTLTLTSSGS